MSDLGNILNEAATSKAQETAASTEANASASAENNDTAQAAAATNTEAASAAAEAQTNAPLANVLEINDDSAMAYLKDKHELNYENLNQLTEKLKAEPAKHKYASTETEAIDNFQRETGRPAADFFKLQQDFNTIDKTQRIMDFYKEEYPNMSAEQAAAVLKLDMKPLDPADHDESDVQQRAQEILVRDGNLAMIDAQAKKSFEERKQTYASPTEELSQQAAGSKAWTEGVTEVVTDFDLGIEGYKYEPNQAELTKKYATLENLLGNFVDDKGGLDYKKLVQTIERGFHADKISKISQDAGATAGATTVIDELSNTSTSGAQTRTPQNNESKISPETQAVTDRLMKSLYK